jgi:hypothetical protein
MNYHVHRKHRTNLSSTVLFLATLRYLELPLDRLVPEAEQTDTPVIVKVSSNLCVERARR